MTQAQLQQIIGLLIQAVLIPVIPLVGLWIRVWISKQVEKIQKEIELKEIEKLDFYLGELERIVATVVVSIEETIVEKLKAEENWNEETMAATYQLAKERVLSLLKYEGIQILNKGLVDYEGYIEDLIETLNAALNPSDPVVPEVIPEEEIVVPVT